MSTQSTDLSEGKSDVLSEQTYAEIDQWLKKYPPEQKKSAVMAALRIAQDENKGYLTTDIISAIAKYLAIPAIEVQEVATFYSMYEHNPVGKHKICVCTNISCMLNGSEHILDYIYERLGIKPGETTKDGKFTLKEVECLGACVGAPMLQVGKEYHEYLTPEKVDALLSRLD